MKEEHGAKDPDDTGRGFGFLRRVFSSMFGGRDKDTANESVLKRTFTNLFRSELNSSGEPDSLQHKTQSEVISSGGPGSLRHKSRAEWTRSTIPDNLQPKSRPESASSTERDNFKHKSRSKGLIIEELDSKAEGVQEIKEGHDDTDAAQSNRNPIVELPEDQENGGEKRESNSRAVSYTANCNREEKQTRNVSFKRVTSGGIKGAYYTATTCRAMHNGVTLEETKQADRSTCQAQHRISRGIDGKGHSILRRLNSDGKVDTRQILHNLNEDELMAFEKEWKNDAGRHLQGCNDKLDFLGNAGDIGKANRPLVAWGSFLDTNRVQARNLQGRPKKVVTVNIEWISSSLVKHFTIICLFKL